MSTLESIAENAREDFEVTMKIRDKTLSRARLLIRHASRAIRATHRDEPDLAQEELANAAGIAENFNNHLRLEHPDIYYTGYTQDALKEFAEANLVFAMVKGDDFPSPAALQVPYNTYLKGLAEAATEMRRRCLDQIREGRATEAEDLLDKMEEIYSILVTMDYPDAITGGLRRQTDIVRSVMERTRGDLTISLRQQQLEESLRKIEEKLNNHK